jgi:hypothetical protein
MQILDLRRKKIQVPRKFRRKWSILTALTALQYFVRMDTSDSKVPYVSCDEGSANASGHSSPSSVSAANGVLLCVRIVGASLTLCLS